MVERVKEMVERVQERAQRAREMVQRAREMAQRVKEMVEQEMEKVEQEMEKVEQERGLAVPVRDLAVQVGLSAQLVSPLARVMHLVWVMDMKMQQAVVAPVQLALVSVHIGTSNLPENTQNLARNRRCRWSLG